MFYNGVVRFVLCVCFKVEVFCYISVVWFVYVYCVYFVEESNGVVFFSQVVNFFNGVNGFVYVVDGFKGDDFGDVQWQCCEFFFQIFYVVVFKDDFFGFRVMDILDY